MTFPKFSKVKPEHQAQLERIYHLLMVQKFRDYSRGWYRGWIIVSSPHDYYGKMIKTVNGGGRPETFSAYPPEIVYQDTDGVIIRGGK